MDNINQFISEFNLLHKAMNDKAEVEIESFGRLLHYMKKNDRTVEHYYDQLDVIRDLRNTLVHEKVSVDFELAIPTDEIIARIKHIRESIEMPGAVKDFFTKEVATLHVNDPLSKLLARVKETPYSQFPIFSKQGMVGVLSDNGVAKWLAREFSEEDDDIVNLRYTRIGDLIQTNEVKNKGFYQYRIIHPHTSLYLVEEIFQKELRKGNNLLVLLLSEKKKINKPYEISGIITTWDLPKLDSLL